MLDIPPMRSVVKVMCIFVGCLAPLCVCAVDSPRYDLQRSFVLGLYGDRVLWVTKESVPRKPPPPGSPPQLNNPIAAPNRDVYLFEDVTTGEVAERGDFIHKSGPSKAALKPDGTVIAGYGSELVWLEKDGGHHKQVLVGDFGHVEVLAVFPEGVILHWPLQAPGDEPCLVYWAPIRAGQADLQNRRQLTAGSHRGSTFIRAGDEVAWLDMEHVQEARERRTVRVFNVRTEGMRRIETDSDALGSTLVGFDGRFATNGTKVINLEGGQTTDVDARNAIGLVKGTLYTWEEDQDHLYLVAIPADRPKERRRVATADKGRLNPQGKPNHTIWWAKAFAVGDSEIRMWDGERWQRVAPR